MCALDSHYYRLFHRLATGNGVFNLDATIEGSSVSSNSSTSVRERPPSTSEKEENAFVRRVVTYLTSSECLLPLPIGECLVAGVRNNLPTLSGAGMLISSSSAVNQLPPAFNPPLPMGTTSVGEYFFVSYDRVNESSKRKWLRRISKTYKSIYYSLS